MTAKLAGTCLALLLAIPSSAPALAASSPTVSSTALTWPAGSTPSVLTVAGPSGAIERRSFAAGAAPEVPLFGANGSPRPDGVYVWELVAAPGRGGRGAAVASGTFAVRDGRFVDSEANDEGTPRKDQTVADDLIVKGSACVGLDCLDGEVFGTDNVRLKANVLRLKFEDSSSTAGMPTNDWQLVANDAGSGGAEKFSIEDVTGGKTPFTITAGAPNNSLFVGSTGRIGLGTAVPSTNVHVTSGNTPALRLEQNTSAGQGAQSWDLATNSDRSFALRDITAAADGSRQPVKVQPGAPTNSVVVTSAGFVGLGKANPEARLHIYDTQSGVGVFGPSKLLVENASATREGRELFELKNNGDVAFLFDDTSDPQRWYFGTFANGFLINNQETINTFELFLGPTGNLTIGGTLTQNSDRETKTDITAIDSAAVLEKVAALPLSTWRQKTDAPEVRHLGPMAQDFAAAFKLGPDDKHIAPVDLAGVSLAAIQALAAKVEALEQENARLQAAVRALEAKGEEVRP